jgi:hypothetical protein
MALSTEGFTIVGNPKASSAKSSKPKRARPSKEAVAESVAEPEPAKEEPPPPYHHFQVGETVMVAARTFPGSNKQGGVGRVTKVHEEEAEAAAAGLKVQVKDEAGKEATPDCGEAAAAAATALEGVVRDDGIRWKVVSVDVKYVLGGSERQVSRQYVRLGDGTAGADGAGAGNEGGGRGGRSGRNRSNPGGVDGAAKPKKSRAKKPKQDTNGPDEAGSSPTPASAAAPAGAAAAATAISSGSATMDATATTQPQHEGGTGSGAQLEDGNGDESSTKRKVEAIEGSKDAPPAKKLSIESFFS